MHIKLVMSEAELKKLIIAHFAEKLGDLDFKGDNLKIEVKSTQNYKSEWETAQFRATYEAFGQ